MLGLATRVEFWIVLLRKCTPASSVRDPDHGRLRATAPAIIEVIALEDRRQEPWPKHDRVLSALAAHAFEQDPIRARPAQALAKCLRVGIIVGIVEVRVDGPKATKIVKRGVQNADQFAIWIVWRKPDAE